MNKYRCDNCGSTDTYVKDYTHSYPVKGEPVEVTTKRRFCTKCNSLVYDSYLDNETLKTVFRTYNKSIGVDPDKIIELRKRYNLSQEEFAKIIGCAKKTLVSYEQGATVPNDIYLVSLKMLIENPEIIRNMIDANVLRYSEEELEEINKKLYIPKKENDELTDLNGYTYLSIYKIKELIHILTKKPILKTKLLKEMFYCDFLYYKHILASITGLEYAKFQYGPVPVDYDGILNYLIENDYIEETVEYNGKYESHLIKAKKRITIKNLNDDEIKQIEKVRDYFKDYSVKDIVEYSHKEKGFLETNYNCKISYNYCFDIEDV